MVYNEQFSNPFSVHDNVTMDSLSAYKLHTKYLPDGLDYATIYNEQEKMFRYVRHKKTQEILNKYKDILKINTDEYKNETKEDDEIKTIDEQKNNGEIANTENVTNEITKKSKVLDCIQTLSDLLKSNNYTNKDLLQDVLQLRKMYMYEKQKMLKERILPFLQQNLTNEQLLQSIEYKNKINTIKDAIEYTDMETKYIKQQKEREKQRLVDFCKEINEMYKKQKENDTREYENIKKCYASVYNIHKIIERKKEDAFTKKRKIQEHDEVQQKKMKNDENSDSKNKETKQESKNRNKKSKNKSKRKSKNETSDVVKDKIIDARTIMLNEITEQKDEDRLRINIFMDLPSKRKYPDYYKAIKNPISVNIIKRKLKTKEYSTEDMKNDLFVMFDNAIEYNTEGSEVHSDAVYYKNLVQTLYEKYTDK
ncbi:ATP-dependent DNA helicase Snf21 [Binucleata daphniae]